MAISLPNIDSQSCSARWMVFDMDLKEASKSTGTGGAGGGAQLAWQSNEYSNPLMLTERTPRFNA